MEFGVFYVLEAPDGDYKKGYDEMMDQIEYAEELGFDAVWLAEHHSSAIWFNSFTTGCTSCDS